MKKRKVLSILTIILMSISSLVHAQESNQSINSKLIEEYKTLIKDKMQTGHLVGVGAALILGDTVWKEGFGYADKEKKIPFTTNTALCPLQVWVLCSCKRKNYLILTNHWLIIYQNS